MVSLLKLFFRDFGPFSFLKLFEHGTLLTLDFVIQNTFRVSIQNPCAEMPIFITRNHRCGRLRDWVNLIPGRILDFTWLTSRHQFVSCDWLLLEVEDR